MSSSSSRNLIVLIESKIVVTSYNTETHQITNHQDLRFPSNNAQFFLQLQSIFNLKRIKAITFLLTGAEFLMLKKQYEFCCECREFCQKNGIFYYFPSLIHIKTDAITHTKTMVKEGEKVLIFAMDFVGMPPIGISLIRKKDCYEIVKQGTSDYQPFTHEWEEDMIGTLKPKKIIFLQGTDTKDLKVAQRFFKSYDPVVVLFDDISSRYIEPFANKILLLMDKKASPYDVANPCWWKFDVRYDGKSLIKTSEVDVLPFEKSVVIPVKPNKRLSLFCGCGNIRPSEMFEDIKLSTFKCKKVTVTLKIDVNILYDLKIDPFVESAEKKQEMLEESDATALPVVDEKPLALEKARMIFDKQNFSVVCFADGNEYNIRDSDGMDKIPIYISFTEKKPIIGKAAMDAYAEKPKFVIFDLIKLCSISNTDIENPKWRFTLSKEDESIYVKMDTVDGERKSTVEFLLALILKNGKHRIKKEYGKKMKDIEIGFNGFVPNEILKKNFIEAGKLLNINVVFV